MCMAIKDAHAHACNTDLSRRCIVCVNVCVCVIVYCVCVHVRVCLHVTYNLIKG